MLACAGGPDPLTGSHCCPGPHPLRPQFLQGMAPVGPVFLESRSTFPRRSQGQGSVTSATGGEALSLNPASPYLRHKPDQEKACKRWSVSVAKCVQTRENVTEGETGVGLVTWPPPCACRVPRSLPGRNAGAPTWKVSPEARCGRCRPCGSAQGQASPLHHSEAEIG